MTNYDPNNPYSGNSQPQNNGGYGQADQGYGLGDQNYGQTTGGYGNGYDQTGSTYANGYNQTNQGYQAFPNAEHHNNLGMQQAGQNHPGVGSRFLAYFLDGIVTTIITSVIFFLFFWKSFQEAVNANDSGALTTSMATFSLISIVVWYVYRVLMEVKAGGSLGRMATGTRVVTTSGQPVDWVTSIKRNSFIILGSILGIVPAIGSLLSLAVYIAVGVTIAKSPIGQSFTDKFANAVVVKK